MRRGKRVHIKIIVKDRRFLAACGEELQLYPEKAPVTVGNFLRYVDEDLYGGATFYHVVRDDNQDYDSIRITVIQGGLFDDDAKSLPPIAHETTEQTGILHRDGVISMARWHPGTATDDFFICVGDQPDLDYAGGRNPGNQGFAAFGKVVEGMETVLKIHNIPAPSQYLDPQIKILEISRIKQTNEFRISNLELRSD